MSWGKSFPRAAKNFGLGTGTARRRNQPMAGHICAASESDLLITRRVVSGIPKPVSLNLSCHDRQTWKYLEVSPTSNLAA
jgi:hypothetical protein